MYNDLISEIQSLKKDRDAVILAHFYEEGDIQDIADYIGDSFFLARKGQELENKVILLAGVVFMAESVKLLNPEKTVLVPDLAAGCSLVDGAPFQKYLEWRKQTPNGVAITYINSSAEVKSISDVICTSSNAAKIVESIPKDRPILFGPDKNLGKFLSKELDREMDFWPGSCEVHVLFNSKMLFELKTNNPGAVVLAHPECEQPVLDLADIVGSTSRLLKEAQENPAETFIVVTEPGIIHQMKKSRPNATFIPAPVDENCQCNNCPYMKMNTLEKIRNSLRDLSPEVVMDASLKTKARLPLQRMIDIADGKEVTWPDSFSP